MSSKNTLVVGASPKPSRYSNQAVSRLAENGHTVYAVGLREGVISGISISKTWPARKEIDTVTLYLNPKHQEDYYQGILELNPKRVIFNPGTENPEFQTQLTQAGIEVEIACTLVMLSIGNY